MTTTAYERYKNIINNAKLSTQQKYATLIKASDKTALAQALADDYISDYNSKSQAATQVDANLIEMFNRTDGSKVHDQVVEKLSGLQNGKVVAQLLKQEIANDNAPILRANQAYRQGHIGDCWLVASIFAVAQRQDTQDILRRNIHAVKDPDANGKGGVYKITFEGDPENNVYIVTSDEILAKEAGGTLSNNKITKPTIEQIVEAGMYQYIAEHPNCGSSMTEGGYNQFALHLLTGRSTTTSSLSIDNFTDVLKQLCGNVTKGRVSGFTATLSGGSGGPDNTMTTRSDNNRHAFTIRAVDWDKKMIGYTNPWDTATPHQISFDNFAKIINNSSSDLYIQMLNAF